MSEREADVLIRAAEAVADGSPFDWDSHGKAASGKTLHHLRLVERIGEVHRSLQDEGGGDDAPSSLEPTPSQWGPLVVLERLGSGGYGEVFRAHDPALQRDVALKLLRPTPVGDSEEGDVFLAEARKLAQVRHRNVVVIHGVDRHGARSGLWTDLLEGQTLETLLRERGPFGAEEAALIGIDVCRALAAVHAADLVHRDIKTANIMREAGGRIVLLDFSTATRRSEGSGSRLPGTPLYMAPELFLGADSGTSADIYALGVVLYRLVTGRHPVEAKSINELASKLGRGEATPLRDLRPDLPTTFVQVVERALNEDPGRRYATAGEMERDLAAALGSTPRSAPLPGRRPRRRTWAMVAAAVFVAAAVGLALMWSSIFGSFNVDASLFRAGEGTEERLLPGGTVLSGDDLFLEIRGSSPMHVYVLNEDAAGQKFLLFPLEGLDLQNPLAPGRRHRLPGSIEGVPNYWEVTSASGEEVVLVIASREPLGDLESEIGDLARAGSAVAVAIDEARVVGTLRGIGGLAPAASPDESELRLSGISRRLSEQASESTGLWVWETRLNSSKTKR